VIARSPSVDADRRPTLPKWTALAAAKSGGGTPRVETSGRLDIKHRQRLAAFISAPFLHFRTPFCEPAAQGEPNATFARLVRPGDATVTARNTRAHRRRLSRAMSLLIEALRYRG
jgi:hypothetical protein